MRKFFIITLLVFSCTSVKLPGIFKKCNRNQPDLKTCIFEAAQDGIPKLAEPLSQLRLPGLNPFKISKIELEGEGVVAVSQKFYDCRIYGLHAIKLKQFEFDFAAKTLRIESTYPEIKHQCRYEFSGRVLLLPIQGTGPSQITLKNLQLEVLLKFEEIRRNQTYIRMVSADLDLKPELIRFRFENLFNGDKRLGDRLNDVLNENWKELFADAKAGHIQVIKKILINSFNTFFSKVSLEEALD